MPPTMWRDIRGRTITAGAIVAVGLVWVGQGLGLLRGSSFMVGDARWAILGVGAVALGVALLVSDRLSTR